MDAATATAAAAAGPGAPAPKAPGLTGSWPRRIGVAVVIVLVVLVIFLVVRRLVLGPDHFTIEHTRPVLSQVDGVKYRVHEDHNGAQRAADMLARLNAKTVDLMRALRARYVRGPDGDAFPERREAVEHLLSRYNPDNLAENSPKDPSGDTSYTLDKGAVVAICLRRRGPSPTGDPRADDIHDLDTLFFVTLHEMAHIAIDDIDHPKRFWSAFRFLLEAAEEAGVYQSPDFARAPRSYCGVTIDYNPRFDSGTFPI